MIGVESKKKTFHWKASGQGIQLFKTRHVLYIVHLHKNGKHFVKSQVLPSMKRDKIYTCFRAMTSIGGVLKAHCKCPAGIDGRCNFVASVLFDFEQHFKYRQKCSVDADESWTSKPCKWSVPKKCKGPVKPISNEIWKSCSMDTYSSSRSQQFVRTHCLTYQCHQISADYGRNRRAN